MTSPRQQERLPAATAQQQHPTAGGKAPVKALPPGTPRNSALGGKQLPPGYGSRSSSDADDTDDEHGLLGSEGDGRVARSATATPASRFSSSGASAMDQGDDADESFAQYEDVSEVEDVHASDDGASDSADNSDAEDNNAMDLDRDDATDDFDDDEELSDDPGLFDDDEDDDDFSPKGARKSAKGRVTKPSVKAREAAGIVEPSTNGSSRAVTRIKLKTPAKTPTAAGKKVGAFGSKKGGSASKKTSGSKKAPAPRSEDKPSIANKAAHVPPPNANVEMEKIIYRRFTKPEAATTPVTAGGKVPSTAQAEPVEEFLIKFKNRSYMHCEWVTRKWIEENDKRGKQRVKYFLEKTIYDISYSLISEDRPFNDSYLKIDRVLEEMDYADPFSGEMQKWLLVKWCAQPYENATWEPEPTLEATYEDEEELEQKVSDFRRRNKLPHVRDVHHYDKCIPPGVRAPANSWEKIEEKEAVFKDGNTLRPYQLEGLNWLLYCWYHRQSCIIADEMGLGKTVQSVAFLNRLYTHEGVKGPFLIVAPLSTIPHWERTVNGWTDMNCVVFHGSAFSRNILQQYEFFYRDNNKRKLGVIAPPNSGKSTAIVKHAYNQFKFDVMITTYEMAMSAAAVLRNVPSWRCVIVDEAHRLKNKGSKVGEVMKTFNFEHRVLLTGTPIQNSLEELWSILNFLDGKRFPDGGEKSFLSEFDLKSSADVERLQSLIKPLMLRRLKEDVEKSIPVKEETVIEVELTKIQRAYYRAILERNFVFLKQGTKKANVPNLINTMMELRKCCVHPYLISGAEEKVLAEANAMTDEDHFNCLVQASGKLVLLDKLLPKLKEGGHRVLIFSQMTRVLDILSDYLRLRHYNYERIDGGIRGDARQAAIDRFSAEGSDSFVFLLCTRAGGVGINLTAADTCIIYDSDWNPQNDLQAQARCHRIGQKKNVKIYRLITRNTYEKVMFDRAGMKLGLDKAVLSRMEDTPGDDFGSGGGASALSKNEIDSLLKKGAYAALMDNEEDPENDAAKQFCEEDIDSILERRTQVIRRGPQEERPVDESHVDGTVAADGSLFSKATFSLGEETTAEDDLEDPHFWEKWAQKANIDTTVHVDDGIQGLIVEEPRRRKRTQHLNMADDSDEVASLPEKTKAPSRSSKKNAVLPWSLAERTRLERSLMMYGFGAWEKKISQFPKRSINDIKSAELRVLRYCVEKMRESIAERAGTKVAADSKRQSSVSTSSEAKKKASAASREENRVLREDQRLVDDIDAMVATLQWDIPELSDIERMAREGCAESFIGRDFDLEVDPQLGPYPYPGATRDKLLAYRSIVDEAPPEYLDNLGKKKKNLLFRVQLMHFVRQFTVVVDPHAVGDLWTRKLSSRSSTPNDTDGGAEAAPASEEKAVVVDKYKQLFNAVREAHVFPSSYYQPSVYYSTLTGAAAAEGASVPTASIGSFNFDWWKENEDRDLLVGTLKWGYQNFDQIRMDPDLGFSKWKWTLPTEGGAAAGGKSQPPGGETPRGSSSTPVTEASEAVPQNKAVSAVGDGSSVDVGDDEAKPWPTGTELGVRVRRLIHLYQRQMREEEGGVKSAATMIADGEGGFVIEQDHRWSKRDRAEFIKTADHWGMPEEEIHETTSLEAKRKHWHVVDKLPGDRVAVVRRDWALFKQIAGLQHKPDFAMEVFMQAFVTRVEELTTATYPDLLDSYERTGGVVIVPWKGEPLLEEDPRIGAGFTAPCVIGPRDWGSNELDTCEGVSADQGRRIIRHLATMHTLRMRVLPDPKLEGKLEMARHGVGLPDWWSTASTIMDHGFLRGITKHSTDTDTQFRIMLDPELPFRREIVRILGDVGVSVDLDAYEQRRNAALLAAAAKERRGTSAAAAAAAVSAAEEEAVLAVVDQGAEEVGEQELLSGAVRLEDVVGWPRDLIRARRIEYLLDLALSAANVTAPASGVKRKAGEDASNDTAAKRVKTASPTSPAALLESAAAELASRYQSTVGQDRVHRAVEAVTHARNLVAQLEGNTSDMDVQE